MAAVLAGAHHRQDRAENRGPGAERGGRGKDTADLGGLAEYSFPGFPAARGSLELFHTTRPFLRQSAFRSDFKPRRLHLDQVLT